MAKMIFALSAGGRPPRLSKRDTTVARRPVIRPTQRVCVARATSAQEEDVLPEFFEAFVKFACTHYDGIHNNSPPRCIANIPELSDQIHIMGNLHRILESGINVGDFEAHVFRVLLKGDLHTLHMLLANIAELREVQSSLLHIMDSLSIVSK